MRFTLYSIITVFLFSSAAHAGGLTSGKLSGEREDAISPLVEDLKKKKFGNKNTKSAQDQKAKKKSN